jgi:hypothetical protein
MRQTVSVKGLIKSTLANITVLLFVYSLQSAGAILSFCLLCCLHIMVRAVKVLGCNF